MKIALDVVAGPEADRRFEFDGHDRFLIGRAKPAHLRLKDDPRISRNHAIIEISPPCCHLRDLRSRNGTRVNGVRVTEAALNDGDEIGVGRSTLRLRFGDAADGAPTVVLEVACLKCGGRSRPAAAISDTGRRAGVRFLCDSCREAISAAPQPVPGFEVIKTLGRGGMGVVMLARELETGDLVALKTILPSGPMPESALKLFLRETQVNASLSHPHIVAFRGCLEAGGLPVLVMEYVEGVDAEGLLRQSGGRIEPPVACRLADQVLDALGYAHDRMFVHRDIKPQNVLVQGRGSAVHAKLTDFGLAKNFDASGGLSCSGDVRGTIPFMPPEQFENYRGVDHRADLFAAGATLYYLLTGSFAFEFREDRYPIVTLLEGKPVPVRRRLPSLGRALADVVDRSVYREPGRRFASAAEMRSALAKAAST